MLWSFVCTYSVLRLRLFFTFCQMYSGKYAFLFNLFLILSFIFDQSVLLYNFREIFLSSDLNFSDVHITVIVQWSEGMSSSELTLDIMAMRLGDIIIYSIHFITEAVIPYVVVILDHKEIVTV